MDLTALDDTALAAETRQREVALQEAIAEVARRNESRGWGVWSEENCAAVVARKRADIRHWERAANRTPEELLPPSLFRLGYEWCALTLFGIFDRLLDKPSKDIMIYQSFEPIGRGLWKPNGPEKAVDYRRRAILDMIQSMETFAKGRMQSMFFALPPRQSSYTEADDENLRVAAYQNQSPVSRPATT